MRNHTVPHSPFTTRLSGSAKEIELRLRNIFQWKKKRPPIIAFVAAILVIALCGSLVGFRTTAPEEPPVDGTVVENTPSENEPNQEDTTDASAVQPETAHDWAGTGYLYYCAALDASIEFPPEWGSLLHVYDYENTVRIDTLVGWDDTAPDNGRMATIYKFTRTDWDTQSGAYRKGMFEGGPTVQIIAEDENYVYILKRYGGLIGFKTLNDPGFNEYKMIDEALKNYELEIYVNDSSDFGLPDMIELSTSDGKTYPAQRYDGDGWYIYIPEGWSKMDNRNQWYSQYGSGAYLKVNPCTDRMEDIKGYYGSLGAWSYDTDMNAPYDYYYLLNPLGGDAQNEMFFVPVSDTFSYTLACTWVKSTPREGERDLLHAMAASFTVDERIQNTDSYILAPGADQAVLDYYQQQYHRNVYFAADEPSQPQSGDWRIDRILCMGEVPVYEVIGGAYEFRMSWYTTRNGVLDWVELQPQLLVLTLSGYDGTFNQILGSPGFSTEGLSADTIIKQMIWNLMDLEVSLMRDGYAWPAGPGSQVQFHREVYDGPETVKLLENWEPIYSNGDYWAMHSWSGFEALCYHHAATGTYNINRIDTTRTDLFTHRGIRVGDSREDVIAAYPELKSGDYWGLYPGEDILWYCDDPNDFGAALIFFFEGNTVSRIVLNNMFN